jgi:uroporphyrinogen-III decarboxylase
MTARWRHKHRRRVLGANDMDSKNAVFQVLRHEQPDYIPLGTYAIDTDTAARIIGHKTYVRDKAGIQIALWDGRRDEVAQSLKEDSVTLFEKLPCIDIIIPFKEASLLPPADYIPQKVKKLDDKTWETEGGVIYRYSELTNDILPVHIPKVDDTCNYDGEPICYEPDPSVFEAYDHLVKKMGGTRFIAGISGGFNPMVLLGGMEDGLVEYYINPERVKAAALYYAGVHDKQDKYYIRDGYDAIFVEDDFASTQGPMISPDVFRDICLPVMKQRIHSLKKRSEKVMLHSCGNTWKLLDMFIEAGVDCYQSLQTGAGMALDALKAKYGRQLSFWGGVSVETLISGTADEVRQDVRRAFRSAREDGGFILGPSHSIAYGVKYDNFCAMIDEHDKLKYTL